VAWLRASTAPLSGEDLARRLGCSRAAVWKQIGALRRLGYRIEARRAHGYALAGAPDRLGPAELAPHLAGRWRDIRWLAETDSTQRVARELGRAGAPEGTVVIAEAQTAGRGRLGRTWHSPRGVNLYCSIVLRPALSPAAGSPAPPARAGCSPRWRRVMVASSKADSRRCEPSGSPTLA